MFGIIAIGDSLIFGRGELPATGWTGRLKKDFEKIAYDRCFFNLGYPGESCETIKERFEIEIKSRIKNNGVKNKFIILIGVGINDIRKINSSEEIEINFNEYKLNIKKLIKIAKKYCEDIIFIGLTPIDEDKTTVFKNLYFSNTLIEKYTNFLKEISSFEEVGYIDIFTPLNKIGFEKISGDGLHPNKEGYDIMYKIIKKYLEDNKYNLF